ncbi:MAG: TlpA family protein disulfide reductase [Acidimicrobiales bacterium]
MLVIGAVIWTTVVAWNQFGSDARQIDSPLIERPAPEFALPGLDGGTVSSADFTGRVYVINFWASWCVPCRQEAPHLEAFFQRWSPQVGLVGIVYQDRRSDAREFREEFGLSFPQAMDPDGRTAIDFGVFGVPETYVIDERGIVMAKLIGAVGPTTLDEVVAEVIAGATVTEQNDDYRTGPDDDGG